MLTHQRKALATLIAAVATLTAQQTLAQCNKNDDLSGWGIWCGASDFLIGQTNQAPPAAGGGNNGGHGGNGPSFGPRDSSRFGCQLNKTTGLHIAVPDGDSLFYAATVNTTFSHSYDNNTQTGRSDYQSTYVGVGTGAGGIADDRLTVVVRDSSGAVVRTGVFNGLYEPNEGVSDQQVVYSDSTARTVTTSTSFDYYSGSTSYVSGNKADGSSQYEEKLIDGSGWTQYNGSGQSTSEWTYIYNYVDGVNTGYYVSSSTEHTVENGVSEVTGVSSSTWLAGGTLTPLSDIQALSAGNVIASYNGHSHSSGQTVSMEVDFGASRFTGEWNSRAGRKQKLMAGPTATDISFSASGRITGQHLVSDRVSGTDVTGGQVQASFFGSNANGIAGAYHVQSTSGEIGDVFSVRRSIQLGDGFPGDR